MPGMFWLFWQIWSIWHQSRVFTYLGGEMQRILAISRRTLFLSQKVKIDLKWLSCVKQQNPAQKQEIGKNYACPACFGHFSRFRVFRT